MLFSCEPLQKERFKKCSVNKTWIGENLLHKFCCLETGLPVIATLLKRNSNTAVFLWILGNVLEHLFLQNTSTGCFCKYVVIAKSEIWKYKLKKWLFFSKLKKLRLDHDYPLSSRFHEFIVILVTKETERLQKINLFHGSIPFLYQLKTSENLIFWCFEEVYVEREHWWR